MKKYLYIAIAAATLASCSQDDTLDVIQGEAIQFGNVFVGKSTRAAEATDPSYGDKTPITSFRLYGTLDGINIYNAVNVTKGTKQYNEAWTCPVTQYWVDGADYEFAAVVNDVTINGETVTVNNGAVTLDGKNMPSSIAYTADGTTDLLYAKITRNNVGSTANDKGIVAFSFDHLLAKAKFTLSNITDHSKVQQGTAYTYDIKNLKITNTYGSGTYNVDNTWSNLGTATPTEFGNISNLVNGISQVCEAEKLLIPGLTEVTVSFEYDIKLNGTIIYTTPSAVTKTVAIPSTVTDGKIKANNAYNFQLNVGLNTPIEFTVTAAPTWVTPTHDVSVPEQKQ